MWNSAKAFFLEIHQQIQQQPDLQQRQQLARFVVDITKQLVFTCFANPQLIAQKHQRLIISILNFDQQLSGGVREMMVLCLLNLCEKQQRSIGSGVQEIVAIVSKLLRWEGENAQVYKIALGIVGRVLGRHDAFLRFFD